MSAEERGFPGGKGRKKLFLAEIAFIGPFGSRMPGVRVPYSDQNFDRKRKIISAFGHFYIFLIEKPVLKSKAALIYVFI